MGLEMYGFVDGKQAFAEFLKFMPEKIKVRCFDGACAECGREGGRGGALSFLGRVLSFYHPHTLTLRPPSSIQYNRPTSTTKPWSS